jgi:hypothetical protein
MSKDEYITELEMETFDLIADGTFTFRDGDRWARFDPETEFKYEEYTKEENEDYG